MQNVNNTKTKKCSIVK